MKHHTSICNQVQEQSLMAAAQNKHSIVYPLFTLEWRVPMPQLYFWIDFPSVDATSGNDAQNSY